MKLIHTLPRRLSLISLLIATTACAVGPMDRPPAEATSQTLWRQIQAEVGMAACDGPQQCHSSAVGAKACGGPDSYLAWSSKNTDATQLRGLIEQHAAARRAENLASSRMSNCSLVTDPGASCQAGRCSLNHNAGGGTS